MQRTSTTTLLICLLFFLASCTQTPNINPTPTANDHIPPSVVNPGDQTGLRGDAIQLAIEASDDKATHLSFGAYFLPDGLSIDGASGLISGNLSSAGNFEVKIVVSDSVNSTEASFSWQVAEPEPTNNAPTLTTPDDQTNPVGETVRLELQAEDADGDALSFTAQNLPEGLSLSSEGVIEGTLSKVESYLVDISVDDGKVEVSSSFTWQVTEKSNSAPNLETPQDQENTVGQKIELALVASDSDGDELSFTAEGLPKGLSIDSSTGVISGVLEQAENDTVTVSADDGKEKSTASFKWTVNEIPNQKPSLTNPGNQTSPLNTSVVLNLQASDPDGDKLSFSATGLPNGLTINAQTGEVSGTVLKTGSFSVTINVSDTKDQTSQHFSWLVTETTNHPPVLSNPGKQTTPVNQQVSLKLSASDQDGDSLKFSAQGLPNGLSINEQTGEISGTPQALGSFEVTASVSDSKAQTNQSFFWDIVPLAEPAKLIAQYNFEETSGNSVLDSSGSNNNGSADSAERVAGKVGQALHMNNNVVTIPNSSSLTTTAKQITVMAWVNREVTKNVGLVNHAYPDLFLGFHGTQFKWQFRNAQGVYAACYAGEAPLGEWFHVVGTYDGQVARLYVNGVEICTDEHTGDIPMAASPWTIGAIPLSGNVNGDALIGTVDDVRIYDKALTESAIVTIYNANK